MIESSLNGDNTENLHNDLVTLLANMASSSIQTSDNKVVFLKEIKRISKMNEWGTTWLFFVMSNALDINIHQFYPNSKNTSGISMILNGKIKPLLNTKKRKPFRFF